MPPNLHKSQSPSPSQSPNGAAADSSPASAPASTSSGAGPLRPRSSPASTSSGAAAFVADPGTAFDPEAAGPAPEPEADVLEVGWEEERVRQLLRAQGVVLHAAVAVDKTSEEWLYSDHELRAVAGPLTNILNRYDATRAAAAVGDELALIIGLTGYASRSYLERRRLLAELADEPDVPITGLAPDPTPQEAPSWAT